jgi:hypothetical protein
MPIRPSMAHLWRHVVSTVTAICEVKPEHSWQKQKPMKSLPRHADLLCEFRSYQFSFIVKKHLVISNNNHKHGYDNSKYILSSLYLTFSGKHLNNWKVAWKSKLFSALSAVVRSFRTRICSFLGIYTITSQLSKLNSLSPRNFPFLPVFLFSTDSAELTISPFPVAKQTLAKLVQATAPGCVVKATGNQFSNITPTSCLTTQCNFNFSTMSFLTSSFF